MRSFIAVDVSKDVNDHLLEIQKQLDSSLAKFTLAKQFHLTLKFLGEVSEDKLDEIKDYLNKIDFEKFSLELGNIGVFPNENYIKVIWVGLNPMDKINELQQNVDESLSKLFKKEKNFHPHLTLARVKFVKDKDNFIKILKNIGIKKLAFQISDFKLYKSTLTPNGPIYEELCIFK